MNKEEYGTLKKYGFSPFLNIGSCIMKPKSVICIITAMDIEFLDITECFHIERFSHYQLNE